MFIQVRENVVGERSLALREVRNTRGAVIPVLLFRVRRGVMPKEQSGPSSYPHPSHTCRERIRKRKNRRSRSASSASEVFTTGQRLPSPQSQLSTIITRAGVIRSAEDLLQHFDEFIPAHDTHQHSLPTFYIHNTRVKKKPKPTSAASARNSEYTPRSRAHP